MLREAALRIREIANDARAVASRLRERDGLEPALIAGTVIGIARTLEDHADLADRAADAAGEPR